MRLVKLLLCYVFAVVLLSDGVKIVTAQGDDTPVVTDWFSLTEDAEDKKLLQEMIEKTSKNPKEDASEGYELIKNTVERFRAKKLRDHFYLFLSEASMENGDFESAKRYADKVTASSLPLYQQQILVSQLRMTQQYDKVIQTVTDLLTKQDKNIQGEARAEFEINLLFATIKTGKKIDILAECKRILDRQDESRNDALRRQIRLAYDLPLEYRIKIIEWLQTEMKPEEIGIPFLNNLSFTYAELGNMEKSIEIRRDLIKKFSNDPQVIDQMSVLASDLEQRKNETDAAEIEALYKDMLNHPLATEEQKNSAKRNIEIKERIKRGQSTSDLMLPPASPAPKLPPTTIEEHQWSIPWIHICFVLSGIIILLLVYTLRQKK
ncbi:MAG: hypothetical protein LBQ66_11130 [Planctomycetaceae bacterium]|nr:hypothetical protein [Planctomycetaceae bacterium]